MDNLVTRSVDRYIREQNQDREPDGKWHPSSVSSPCVRRAVLEKRGVRFSAPPDDETKRIFMMGKIIHKLVQDAVAQDPDVTLVIPEIEVSDPLREVVGQGDILLFNTRTETYELIEIKSIKQQGVRYGIPKQEHRIQAGIYAYILREHGGRTQDGTIIPPLGKALESVRFVYVEKETMVIHERVEDAAEMAEIGRNRVIRMQNLERNYELENLPMVDNKNYWFRSYCPYRGSGLCCAD